MMFGSLITLYLVFAIMLALILMAAPTEWYEVALGAALWPLWVFLIIVMIVTDKITERRWGTRHARKR